MDDPISAPTRTKPPLEDTLRLGQQLTIPYGDPLKECRRLPQKEVNLVEQAT
jgi:hypothetical protein